MVHVKQGRAAGVVTPSTGRGRGPSGRACSPPAAAFAAVRGSMRDADHQPGPGTAFDELSQVVVGEHPMESALMRVVELARDVVPGAAEVSVTLVRGDGAATVAATGALARDLDERQYQARTGPCLEAADTGQVTACEDTASESRWPGYSGYAADSGAGSSLSVPVPTQQHVSAALNVYGTQAHAFDEDSALLARTFASYVGLALANLHLQDTTRRFGEQMEAAIASRTVIDQAKGVLMAHNGGTADEAFRTLVRASQRSNRKLRHVAQALVDGAARDRPPGA